MADKLRFRYPGAGGESYLTSLTGCDRSSSNWSASGSVLFVTHLAVQRCCIRTSRARTPRPSPTCRCRGRGPRATPTWTQVRDARLPDDEAGLSTGNLQ